MTPLQRTSTHILCTVGVGFERRGPAGVQLCSGGPNGSLDRWQAACLGQQNFCPLCAPGRPQLPQNQKNHVCCLVHIVLSTLVYTTELFRILVMNS